MKLFWLFILFRIFIYVFLKKSFIYKAFFIDLIFLKHIFQNIYILYLFMSTQKQKQKN
jgi:hypothetical protein